jgi:hypothetical protein
VSTLKECCLFRQLDAVEEVSLTLVYACGAAGEGGLQAVLGLLHLFLEAPRWEAGAMERAKQMYGSHWRSLGKGLERATADRVMAAMLGPDRRARACI